MLQGYKPVFPNQVYVGEEQKVDFRDDSFENSAIRFLQKMGAVRLYSIVEVVVLGKFRDISEDDVIENLRRRAELLRSSDGIAALANIDIIELDKLMAGLPNGVLVRIIEKDERFINIIRRTTPAKRTTSGSIYLLSRWGLLPESAMGVAGSKLKNMGLNGMMKPCIIMVF